MSTQHTLCFTGHRPNKLYGYDNHAVYQPLLEALKRTARQFCDNGFATFITGGAQGMDQLAFWAVHAVKKERASIQTLETIVYVPFAAQPSRWAKEGVFGQREYQRMLQTADKVRIIADEYGIDTTYRSGVVRALFARNEAMVNHSSAVVGLYTHRRNFLQDQGGTAGCLTDAYKKNKNIWLLDPQTCGLHKVQQGNSQP